MHRIIPEAIKAHGKLDVGLPPAPFRLADRKGLGQARQRIKQAIERDLAVDAVGGKLRLPVPALVVAGEKA